MDYCPNYLGEMIFWTGVLISGIGAVSGIGQWIVVLIDKYVKTVPVMVPFVPLYSVEKK